MAESVRRLGWLKDRPKAAHERPDTTASLGSAPVPEKASIRHLVVDILDQGGLGSCVANAILQAVRASHVAQGVPSPELGSRLFGYWFARSYHHATALDEGTYLRYFFEALRKFGFCRESVMPYTDEGGAYTKMPSMTAMRAAFDQANPTEYHRITSRGSGRVDDAKRAIAAGHGVCFGTDISPAFMSYAPGSVIGPPDAKDVLGGHALMLAEYEGDVFGVVNSWGPAWGDGGWCKMSADYVASGQSDDFWLVRTPPRYSE